MRRSRFLKYICIVMMLSSLTRFFFGLSMLNVYTTTYTFGAVEPQVLSLAVITMLIHILCAIAELVSGFIGALNWEEPLLAGKCLRWGIAALVLGLIGNLMQLIIDYGISLLAWLTGAIIPGLFVLASLRFWYYGKKRDSLK